LVEHVHGLHGDREADAVGQAMREAVDVRGLTAGDAAVVSVEEANEADVGATGSGRRIGAGSADVGGCHGKRRIAGWPGRSSSPVATPVAPTRDFSSQPHQTLRNAS